jgi:hypothetical protein
MTTRLAASIVTVCLSAGPALAQAPALSRQQRELLQSLLNAVDTAAAQGSAEAQSAKADHGKQWQTHVMRASDGSHYVAFTIVPPATTPLPPGPALLYIRLATSNPQAAQRIAERSAIRDWLAGSRIDPRLLPRRGIAIGEMPVMGATGAMGSQRQPVTTGVNEMRLMALERERAKQKQEEQDKQRRAELEGKAAVTRELFPFEDFDLASQSIRDDGTRIITRAFTAGPGEYDLFVAWADTSNAKPAGTVRVLRQSLSLPPAATTGLTTGSIILADKVSVLAAPYSPAEQSAHPYSIGVMEIAPALDAVYTRDDFLSVAFQIINPRGSDTGMPDLAVGFRIVRVTAEREAPVASLNPQYYNASTLPADFDLRQGHPVFAAVSAPLASLGRGDYRLKIAINDRAAGTSAIADADFRVIGTPASLLAEAPPLGRPFSRDTALAPSALAPLVDALTPASPSPALSRALATARSGKLIDLLVEEPVPASEAGIRTALTGLALISVGDASAAVQLQRALLQNAPAAPVQYLIGAARALQNRDPDAIAAWQAAITTGQAPATTRQLLVETLLRRGENARAATVIAETSQAPASPAWNRLTAATQIANGRYADAIAVLDTHLAANAGDAEARWLLMHALFADVVKGGSKDRFRNEAQRYIDSKAEQAELVSEWLRIVSTS